MRHLAGTGRKTRGRLLRWLLLLAGAGLGGDALAASVDLGSNTELTYKLVLDYGVAVRLRNQSQALINGPVDPLVINVSQQAFQNGTSFSHTGLPSTINFDDGERNFNKYSLINNRISAFSELELTHQNYGLIVSGDGFYDQVYHHPNDNSEPNVHNNNGLVTTDNNAPSTVNHFGQATRFTKGARYYDGQRLRLLDAYGYADWNLGGDVNLDVRVGKQLVGYGEALFFSGMALAQGPSDATKAFIPGAEVKDILLPVSQASFQLGLTKDLTLMGYYHLDFKADEIFPVGDFYAIQDAVGPGAEFAYGSINPAYGNGCPGLLTNLQLPLGQSIYNTLISTLSGAGINPDNICNLNSVTGPPLGASPYILSYRGPDINPGRWGQYGLGLKYNLTSRTTVGLFALRYSDTTPAVVLDSGCPAFITVPITLTTCAVGEPVPTEYQVKYFSGIHLFGATFSTALGPFNISGEFNYRDKLDMPVQAMIEGELEPVYTRGKLAQADISSIYVTNPDFIFDAVNVVGEVSVIHVLGLTPFKRPPNFQSSFMGVQMSGPSPIVPVNNGQDPFFSKTSWGYEVLILPQNHNVFPGWDFTWPISFQAVAKGNPEMAGAFGAAFGEGDQRLSVGVGATYLDNLEFGIAYNMFFGDANVTIRGSQLHEHPYTDRENATFSVKYEF